jgi:transcriptional regulator with XRE-family HTH domain
MPRTESLSNRLRRLAEAKGLSSHVKGPCRELAKQAGLSHVTVWQLLNGHAADPKLSTLAALAESLGVSTKELVADLEENKT